MLFALRCMVLNAFANGSFRAQFNKLLNHLVDLRFGVSSKCLCMKVAVIRCTLGPRLMRKRKRTRNLIVKKSMKCDDASAKINSANSFHYISAEKTQEAVEVLVFRAGLRGSDGSKSLSKRSFTPCRCSGLRSLLPSYMARAAPLSKLSRILTHPLSAYTTRMGLSWPKRKLTTTC